MDKRIGAQLYTVRESMQDIESFDETCRKISEIGYKIVQISGTPLGAKEMRECLDKYDLQALTSHKSWGEFVWHLEDVIEYNKALGINLCGIGSMPNECWSSEKGVYDFIEEANKVCEKLKKEGMYFGYHNHAFEYIKYNGKTIMEILMEETDKEQFNFIFDTYWAQVGGKNPADEIRKLGKRAMAIHFKDFAVDNVNWSVPKMCEVGQGNLNWDDIISACDEAGSKWAFVEQDTNHIDNDSFKAMAMSYDFLTTKGFC